MTPDRKFCLLLLSIFTVFGCQSIDSNVIPLRVLVVNHAGLPPVPTGHLTSAIIKANSILEKADVQLKIEKINSEQAHEFLARIEKAGLTEKQIQIGALAGALGQEEKDVFLQQTEELEKLRDAILKKIKEDMHREFRNSGLVPFSGLWYLGFASAWDLMLDKLDGYDMVVTNFPVIEIINEEEVNIVQVRGIPRSKKCLMSYMGWIDHKDRFSYYSYVSDESDYYIPSLIVQAVMHSHFEISNRSLHKEDVLNRDYSPQFYFRIKPKITERTLTEIKSMRKYIKAQDKFFHKNIKASEGLVDEALAIMPENLSAMELKATILLSRNARNEKIKLDQTIAAVKAKQDFIEEIRERVQENYYRAILAQDQGNYQEAISRFGSVTAEDFHILGQEELLEDWYHDSLLSLADMHHQQNDCEQAIPQLQSLLKHWPDDSDAMYIMGMCHFTVGNSEKARTFLRDYLTMNPESIKAERAKMVLRKIEPQEPKGNEANNKII